MLSSIITAAGQSCTTKKSLQPASGRSASGCTLTPWHN